MEIGCSWYYGFVLPYLFLLLKIIGYICSWWYCWARWESWRCVSPPPLIARVIDFQNLENAEIVMVRLQGDFAKPPEKRFNYKHCFDALFRVRLPESHTPSLPRNDVTTCTMLSHDE